MTTERIEWRRATEEEIQNGSPEMIEVSRTTIEVPDAETEEETANNTVLGLLSKMTPEGIEQIKNLLK